MRPTLYTADHPGPGTLSMMAKPRAGDWLEDEMRGLRELGADILVSALTVAETQELELGAEEHHATTAGLEFLALPIPDREVPNLATALPVLQRLSARLNSGAHIVTHCRYGIGRASLLAAALLVLHGLDPDTAWHHVTTARGMPVPDTAEQRQWIFQLADHLNDH